MVPFIGKPGWLESVDSPRRNLLHQEVSALFLKLSTAISLLLALSGSMLAGPISVDGDWSDWGINPDSNQWSQTVGDRIFFEDYTGTDGTGVLGPGRGGQFFDVEAIYAYRAGDQVNFAIVTGFDLDGVVYKGTPYTPGDVFFDVGTGWDVAIDLQNGDLYTGATGSNPNEFPSSRPHLITGGTVVGTADLVFNSDAAMTVYTSGGHSSAHYLIEGGIDLGAVGGAGKSAEIHWTMLCGNDLGEGEIPAPVPEPATICFLCLGALAAGLGARSRRRPKAS